MLAKTTDTLPEGEALRYEPKWDGFRALASVDERVVISAKSGNRLDAKFPELRDALAASLPEGTTVDGEIVRWSGGVLDFSALLRRNAAGSQLARRLAVSDPCHFIAFDLLRHDGADITRRSLDFRRQLLDALWVEVDDPHLMLGWQTPEADTARSWMDGLAAVGVEGLVVKDGRRGYRPGKRDWRKYKTRTTTEAIVGGVTGDKNFPETLVLGRYPRDGGRLRIVGRTPALTRAQQTSLSGHLHRAGTGHPWPPTIRPTWASREPVKLTRIEPTLVVEVSPDTAVSHGRWRHSVRMLRPRPDLRPEDVPTDLDLEA